MTLTTSPRSDRRHTRRLLPWAALIAIGALAAACNPQEDLNEGDWQQLRTLASSNAAAAPPSPTNAWADDPEAADLGHRLFFDRRLSADGTVSCAGCHNPANGFADPEATSRGVGGQRGTRHAPTLVNAAYQDFFFWDGRADGLWSAPLQAIEAPVEANFSRLEVAHLIADAYRADYEATFGPLPDLAGLPAVGRPGEPAWEGMTAASQDAVNTVFANVGKALEAYQRQLSCMDTRFDQVVAGTAEFTEEERFGARMFVRRDEGNCIACHSGPNMSDNGFHNLRLDQPTGELDVGRFDGIPSLLEFTFNGAGAYSDDTGFGARKLADISPPTNADRGRFKTPTLRGVAQRGPLGHTGRHANLRDWINDVYDRRGGGGRGGNDDARAAGTLDPALNGINVNEPRFLEAFLRTLDCAIPARWAQPPGGAPGGAAPAAPAPTDPAAPAGGGDTATGGGDTNTGGDANTGGGRGGRGGRG